MKRWLLSLFLSLLTMVVLMVLWFSHRPLHLQGLWHLSPLYLGIGLAMALADIGLRGWRVKLVAQRVGAALKLWQGMRVCLTVDFFAAITPARIGGEPARLVGLLRCGLNMSKTLVVLGVEALMDLGYLFLALPVFLWCSHGSESTVVQLVRGLIVSALTLLLVLVILVSLGEKRIRRFFMRLRRWPWLYRLASGFGRIRPAHELIRLRHQMLQALRGPWWYLPLGMALTTAWWSLRFASLFWIGAALGFSLPWQEMFWPQFLLYNSVNFVPMPAGGGLFETSFLLFYKNLIPAAVLPMTILLWRSATYYIFVVAGALTTSRSMWRLIVKRLEGKSTAS